jgi:hypothetical protein
MSSLPKINHTSGSTPEDCSAEEHYVQRGLDLLGQNDQLVFTP